MSNDLEKQAAAKAAINYIVDDEIIGVGTGSTVNYFIDELAKQKDRIAGAVASSEETAKRLKSYGIEVFDLNQVSQISVYVDGADEITSHGAMIKGGGGALTREKIIASVAKKFVCIADHSKLVKVLGDFPLPIEVIPMAQAAVARQLLKMGGEPRLRMKNEIPVITDNGHRILDWVRPSILDPVALETELNQIVGIVCVGLFARRHADVALLAKGSSVQTLVFNRSRESH